MRVFQRNEGLRQGVLILLGVMFVMSGFAVLSYPLPDAVIALDPSISAHLRLLSPTGIGWMFVIVGSISALLGVLDRHLIGYMLMQFVSVFWGSLYLVSWLDTGYWRAVFGAAQYALFVGVLWLSSKAVVLNGALVEQLTTPVEIPPGEIEEASDES